MLDGRSKSQTRRVSPDEETGILERLSAHLSNQARSVSVTSNIVEGFERNGNREFIQFLSIFKGSAGEIRDHLYTALDENYVTPIEFDHTYQLAVETGRLLGGFVGNLQRTNMAGSKFAANLTRNSKP